MREPRRIVTAYCPKPTTSREFDWTAWDSTAKERWYGYGRTEEQAVADLINTFLTE